MSRAEENNSTTTNEWLAELEGAAYDVVRSAPGEALENPDWHRALTRLVAAFAVPQGGKP